MRPRILLLAYQISPIRGSEYSVGWNHVTRLSNHCEITVLYGAAGLHMGDLSEVDEYIENNGPIANVRFVPIKPNGLAKFLNNLNRRGILVYSFYLAYRVWHWQAMIEARKIVAINKIDLIHYLNPIGYREPGYLWKIAIPFIWGPIAGLNHTPNLKKSPRQWAAGLKIDLKNFANEINIILSMRVRRALNRAIVIIAANSQNAQIINDRFKLAPLVITENAIIDETIADSAELSRDMNRNVRLIWIGSLDWRKSPDLLLDALGETRCRNWTLDIIGGGPLLSWAKKRAAKLGLSEQITFHGQIPRTCVQEKLRDANLHIITSLSEGNPTVLWEAMAASVPTLTLDHCGMRDTVCDSCGVRVQISDYKGTRDQIATAIDQLILDRSRLRTIEEGVAKCRRKFLWSERTPQWLKIYEDVIKRTQINSGR